MQSNNRDHQIDCPDAQELTAFVEGKLNLQQQSRILQHIRTCSDCHQLAVDVVNIKRDLPDSILNMEADHLNQRPITKVQNRIKPAWMNRIRGFRAATFALPFAAVFLFITLLSPESDWSSEQILHPLKKKAEIQKIIQSITLDNTPSVALSFSNGTTNQKMAFKAGILLSRLEICRKAKDYKTGKHLSENLVNLLNSVSIESPSKNLIDEIAANSSQLNSEDQLTAVIKSTERIFLETPIDYYLRLGLVVETAKAFSLIGKSEIFDKDYFVFIVTQPDFQNLPPGVIRRLKEVNALLANNSIARDSEIIYNLLQETEDILL
ncbi:zf-HC2 domain-containing protein [bacterium]|nr:zf-HC2 domain-containing protein [bacterium]